MDENKCPVCGTFGKTWMDEKTIFVCPNCDSVYSEFGLVKEPRRDPEAQQMCN